jgi:hypothetical protein
MSENARLTMKIRLDSRARKILRGVLRDRERLLALDYRAGDHLPARQRGYYRLAILQARQGLVSMNLRGWLGHRPSPAEAMGCCFQYAMLERRGLIEKHRLYGGRRTTHLKLTEDGEQVARDLVAGRQPRLPLLGNPDGVVFEPLEWPAGAAGVGVIGNRAKNGE